jgi:translation elongation factor EF-Tu-like GTPase
VGARTRPPFALAAAAGLLIGLLPLTVALAAPAVTLIGDDERVFVIAEAAAGEQAQIRRERGIDELDAVNAGVLLRSPSPGTGITAVADLLQITDIALIVMDSTVGPTAAIREQLLIARQARVPMLALLLTNVERLHARAPEESAGLLELEIQELRALLASYALDGDTVGVYYDAALPEPADGVNAFGIRECLRSLANFLPRRVRSGEPEPVSEIWSAVYLLTEREADGHAITLAPRDSIVLWSEGTQSRATLDSVSDYHPGEFREMKLALETPVRAMEGSRILLVRGESVVGLGAVTEIKH